MKSRSAVLVALVAFVFTVTLFTAPPSATAVCLNPHGDITGDGVPDVIDVQCGILSILFVLAGSTGTTPGCLAGPLSTANINCDLDSNGVETINVTDALLLIQMALSVPLAVAVDADQDWCPNACEAYAVTEWSLTPCGGTGLSSNTYTASVLCTGWLSGKKTTSGSHTLQYGVSP